MSLRGKRRGQAALTVTQEPDFKVAKSELRTEREEPRLPKAEMKSLAPRNVGESSKVEVCADQDGSQKVYTHWLLKSEPESRFEKGVDVKFSIEDLKGEPNQTTGWDGIRNYQARKFLRDMKVGQEAFFYHSNCKEPGIAGIIKIVKEAYPDHTQFEKNDPHYDASSTKEKPKWSMVDVQFVRMTKRFIPLAELKVHHQAHQTSGGPLKDVTLFIRQRLSVQPLTEEQFAFILSLEEEKAR
ncbi:thymocyte nuclear protein 1 [Rhineura floridana]|uniref:thymocyte nuclear protein 1 n=1 Tax=Rhineura floridana TaxID=261503 RepID=UPI002AC85E7E|nr:thymocyte nuclear protein 1 [Rhineura floridana]